MFVDCAGKTPHLVDPATGERNAVGLFDAVLGASNFTFAEATHSQNGGRLDWKPYPSLRVFGGVPGSIVPDQLKSGVTTASRDEPAIQRTYEAMAQHYGTTG